MHIYILTDIGLVRVTLFVYQPKGVGTKRAYLPMGIRTIQPSVQACVEAIRGFFYSLGAQSSIKSTFSARISHTCK